MTDSRLKKVLFEDVVIFENKEESKTGAQSIAPDHSPRSAYKDGVLPKRGVLNTDADLQSRVQEYLFYQSELLDRQCWQAFVDLYTPDGVYWMPVTEEQTGWLDSPSIFAEDKHMMQVRLERITHPNAWSQAAEWSFSHVVGNVVVESATDDEIHTRARFHMMELRRDTIRHFAGTYRHTLVQDGQDFKIKLQRIDLTNAQAPFDYVIQAWL